MTRACANCNKIIEVNYWWQRFCSAKCRIDSYIRECFLNKRTPLCRKKEDHEYDPQGDCDCERCHKKRVEASWEDLKELRNQEGY